jgi:hypothetical protein
MTQASIGFVVNFVDAADGQRFRHALHEPAQTSNRSLPWESGAEAARTPNADAWSADSAVSAKRLECLRFIGAYRLAQDGLRFMVSMHAKKQKGAFYEQRLAIKPIDTP